MNVHRLTEAIELGARLEAAEELCNKNTVRILMTARVVRRLRLAFIGSGGGGGGGGGGEEAGDDVDWDEVRNVLSTLAIKPAKLADPTEAGEGGDDEVGEAAEVGAAGAVAGNIAVVAGVGGSRMSHRQSSFVPADNEADTELFRKMSHKSLTHGFEDSDDDTDEPSTGGTEDGGGASGGASGGFVRGDMETKEKVSGEPAKGAEGAEGGMGGVVKTFVDGVLVGAVEKYAKGTTESKKEVAGEATEAVVAEEATQSLFFNGVDMGNGGDDTEELEVPSVDAPARACLATMAAVATSVASSPFDFGSCQSTTNAANTANTANMMRGGKRGDNRGGVNLFPIVAEEIERAWDEMNDRDSCLELKHTMAEGRAMGRLGSMDTQSVQLDAVARALDTAAELARCSPSTIRLTSTGTSFSICVCLCSMFIS